MLGVTMERQRQEITIASLARMTGIPLFRLATLELDQRSPTQQERTAIAEALDADPDELFVPGS